VKVAGDVGTEDEGAEVVGIEEVGTVVEDVGDEVWGVPQDEAKRTPATRILKLIRLIAEPLTRYY
jgi:hypothetical protein